MRYNCCTFLLLASCFAAGQTASPAVTSHMATMNDPTSVAARSASQPASPDVQTPAKDSKPTKEVPPAAVVLTIKGVCGQNKSSGSVCKTGITRQQFDLFAKAMLGSRVPLDGVAPQVKRDLAKKLTTIFILADQADKDGAANDLRTKQMIQLSRNQILAQQEAEKVRKEAKPSDAEIQKFYDDNRPKYWSSAAIERILVPLRGEGTKGADEATMKAFAEEIDKRAQAGEPFDKLQKEAFEKAGVTLERPVKLTVPSGQITPAEEARVRGMKTGEITMENDGVTGYHIFKLVSTYYLQLDTIKADISRLLNSQRTQAELDSKVNSHPADYNNDFFPPEASQQPESATLPPHKSGN